MKVVEFKVGDDIKIDGEIGALTMGAFDGLHLGHQTLIKCAVELAKSVSRLSALLTFKSHPRFVIAPHAPFKLLLWNEFKLDLISKSGIDVVYVLDFDDSVRNESPEYFFNEIILNEICPSNIVVGFNYSFGKNASGNVDVLKKLCDKSKTGLEIMPPVEVRKGVLTSSSNVKKALSLGEIAFANEMLGREYSLKCQIIDIESQNIVLKPFELMQTPSKGLYHVKISDKSGRITSADVTYDGIYLHLNSTQNFFETVDEVVVSFVAS